MQLPASVCVRTRGSKSVSPACRHVPRRGLHPVRQEGGGGGGRQKPQRSDTSRSRRAHHGEVCRQPEPGKEHADHLAALPQPVPPLRGSAASPGTEIQVRDLSTRDKNDLIAEVCTLQFFCGGMSNKKCWFFF